MSSSSSVLFLQEQYNDHLHNHQLIGKGGFGRVFKVFNRLDNQCYAIKQIKVFEYNLENALKEIRILASISHPHIIRYCHSWISTTPYQADGVLSSDEEEDYGSSGGDRLVLQTGPCYFFNIQMEYCISTLRKYLRERTFLDFPVCTSIVFQIIQGLYFLHSNFIVHRDLKPDNVLISSFQPFHIKITDFGLAKRGAITSGDDASSYIGSFLYAAPEQLKDKIFSYASDIYSLGVIIYEIQHLFHTDMERIINIQRLRQERGFECFYFRDLIMDMTDPDMSKRPTISMLKNKYFMDCNGSTFICRDIVWQVIISVMEKCGGGGSQPQYQVGHAG